MTDVIAFPRIARPRPTTADGLVRWIDQRLNAWRARRAQREARAAFLHMAQRDDRLLADMGLTREDVDWAARLPIERNAAVEARERSRKRRDSAL